MPALTLLGSVRCLLGRVIRDLLLQQSDIVLRLDHVRIVVRVPGLQACELGFKYSELLFERVWAGSGPALRCLPGADLLSQQRLSETLVLLRARKRLGCGVEL